MTVTSLAVLSLPGSNGGFARLITPLQLEAELKSALSPAWTECREMVSALGELTEVGHIAWREGGYCRQAQVIFDSKIAIPEIYKFRK